MQKILQFELDAIYINSQGSKSHRTFHMHIKIISRLLGLGTTTQSL